MLHDSAGDCSPHNLTVCLAGASVHHCKMFAALMSSYCRHLKAAEILTLILPHSCIASLEDPRTDSDFSQHN